MKLNEMDHLVGKYCRVISKVPEDSGLDGVLYDFGIVQDFDKKNGLISIKTKNGQRILKSDELFDIICMEEFVTKKF